MQVLTETEGSAPGGKGVWIRASAKLCTCKDRAPG